MDSIGLMRGYDEQIERVGLVPLGNRREYVGRTAEVVRRIRDVLGIHALHDTIPEDRLDLTCSTGSCVPTGKRLCKALIGQDSAYGVTPRDSLTWSPYHHSLADETDVIIDSTYLQFFDVGQGDYMNRRDDRARELEASVGSILIATPGDIRQTYRINGQSFCLVRANNRIRDARSAPAWSNKLYNLYAYMLPKPVRRGMAYMDRVWSGFLS